MNNQKTIRQHANFSLWGKRFIAIILGLILGWVMVEVLWRAGFELLPYPIQVTLRHVHRTPFSEERILPEPIWHGDVALQLISRPGADNEWQYPDPRIGFQVSTYNWLDPDSHVGFRVPNVNWEPQWPVDAVVVGDSFTFCYTEYEACWVQRLATDYDMSMVNLGLVATGSTSHLNVLRTFGLPYEPKLVIWQWYGNDFNDDYGFAVDSGQIEPVEKKQPGIIPNPQTAVSRWLYDHSGLYRLLFLITQSTKGISGPEQFDDPYRLQTDAFQFAYGRSYTIAAADMSLPKNQIGQEISEKAILEAQSLLAKRDIPLVIVLIPTKEEVYAQWLTPTVAAKGIGSLTEGRQQMLTFCTANGLTCLDVTQPLIAYAEQGELLYWERDNHLNGQGNLRLAAAVADFLAQDE